MAYTRKRGRNAQSRLRARRRRQRAARRSVAAQTKANTAKIAKLASQALGWRQYQHTVSDTVSSDLHVERLMDPSRFSAVFQSEDSDSVRSFNMSTLRFKYAYQVESESTGNAWFQMWVVSLKPKFARELRATTNDMYSLATGKHLIRSAMGTSGGTLQGFGNVMLNPAFFKVHHTTGMRRIGQTTMGSTTSGNVTNIRDSTHWGQCTIPWKKTIKAGQHRANGIKDLNHDDIKDSSALYTIFYSNAGESSQLFYAHNYLYTGTSLATN